MHKNCAFFTWSRLLLTLQNLILGEVRQLKKKKRQTRCRSAGPQKFLTSILPKSSRRVKGIFEGSSEQWILAAGGRIRLLPPRHVTITLPCRVRNKTGRLLQQSGRGGGKKRAKNADTGY